MLSEFGLGFGFWRLRRQCGLLALAFSLFSVRGSGQMIDRPGGTITAQLPGTQPVVTLHQLRAPCKARTEIENAKKAYARKDVAGAYRHLSQALQDYPHYSVALTVRAILELSDRQVESAAADLQGAIDSDPEYGMPYVLLGSLRNDSRRYDEALLVLGRADQLLPTAWQTHFETARALAGNQDYEGALREVTRALRRIPGAESAENLALVHLWRASVLLQLKDLPAAGSEYEATLRVAPSGEFATYSRDALAQLRESTAR